jgi:vitamin B12 transporter
MSRFTSQPIVALAAVGFVITLARAQSLAPAVPKAALVDPIVVTAARGAQPLSELLVDLTVISADDIARAGQSSVAELLARQPGVEIATNGGPGSTSAIFLRGANSGHTLILIDGVRVGSSTSGTTPIEAIPLDQIDHIEILRGPASSLYGADALGGVIQIFTKRGDGTSPARVNASAGYGSYDTSQLAAGVAGGTQAWIYALQVGGGHSGGFSAIENPANFSYNPNPHRDGYTAANITASGSWQLGPGHEISGQVFRNRLNAQFDVGPGFDNHTVTTVESYSLASRDQLTASWVSRLQAALANDDSVSNGAFGPSAFRTRQWQYSWQNDVTLPLGLLSLIAERREERLSSDVAFPITVRNTNSADAIYQLRQGSHAIQANLRIDDSSQFGSRTTGALAYGYRLTPAVRATISAGTAFKAPTFNDLYFPSFSNPNLTPEISRNIEAGFYYATGMQQARAVVYRNRVDDLIVFECDANFNCAPQNVDRATLEGVTLGYDVTWGETVLKTCVDVQKPEDDTNGHLLPRRAKRHGAVALTHAIGSLRIGAEWLASSQRFDDAANTRRLGGYAVTNLTLDYALAKAWTLVVRANNVFDKRYELAADYATPRANVFAGVRFQQ